MDLEATNLISLRPEVLVSSSKSSFDMLFSVSSFVF